MLTNVGRDLLAAGAPVPVGADTDRGPVIVEAMVVARAGTVVRAVGSVWKTGVRIHWRGMVPAAVCVSERPVLGHTGKAVPAVWFVCERRIVIDGKTSTIRTVSGQHNLDKVQIK